jgi:hypothetical protein
MAVVASPCPHMGHLSGRQTKQCQLSRQGLSVVASDFFACDVLQLLHGRSLERSMETEFEHLEQHEPECVCKAPGLELCLCRQQGGHFPELNVVS